MLEDTRIRFAIHTPIWAAFVFATAALAQGPTPPAPFMVRYFANLRFADSYVNLTITANGLKSLSVKNDLVSNTLIPGVPLAAVVKLVATTPVGVVDSDFKFSLTNSCDATIDPLTAIPTGPAVPGSYAAVVSSLHAWGVTPHLNTATGAYQLGETEFSNATLSRAELDNITSTCSFINSNGSGFGICKSCLVRGLGAAQQ